MPTQPTGLLTYHCQFGTGLIDIPLSAPEASSILLKKKEGESASTSNQQPVARTGLGAEWVLSHKQKKERKLEDTHLQLSLKHDGNDRKERSPTHLAP
jgi:hypothetical protein